MIQQLSQSLHVVPRNYDVGDLDREADCLLGLAEAFLTGDRLLEPLSSLTAISDFSPYKEELTILLLDNNPEVLMARIQLEYILHTRTHAHTYI